MTAGQSTQTPTRHLLLQHWLSAVQTFPTGRQVHTLFTHDSLHHCRSAAHWWLGAKQSQTLL